MILRVQIVVIQDVCIIRRKLAFHFSPGLVNSSMSPGAWRLCRPLSRIKPTTLGPRFDDN